MKEGKLLSQEISELIRGVLTGKDISKIAGCTHVSPSLLSQILYQQTSLTKKNIIAVFKLLDESLVKAKERETEFAEKRKELEAIIIKHRTEQVK